MLYFMRIKPMTEQSLYLTQLLGTYLVLMGLLMGLRRRFFIAAVREFIASRPLRFVIPVIELVAGLALVIAHNVWTWGPEVVVTIVGWLMVLESFIYMALPEKFVIKFFTFCNKSGMYFWGGFASLLFGLWLINVGFFGG